MKFQKAHLVELPKDYSVEVIGETDKIQIKPSFIHMTYDSSSVYIQYGGDDADKSYAKIEVPSDPAFLRKLSKKINNMAKEIEGK